MVLRALLIAGVCATPIVSGCTEPRSPQVPPSRQPTAENISPGRGERDGQGSSQVPRDRWLIQQVLDAVRSDAGFRIVVSPETHLSVRAAVLAGGAVRFTHRNGRAQLTDLRCAAILGFAILGTGEWSATLHQDPLPDAYVGMWLDDAAMERVIVYHLPTGERRDLLHWPALGSDMWEEKSWPLLPDHPALSDGYMMIETFERTSQVEWRPVANTVLVKVFENHVPKHKDRDESCDMIMELNPWTGQKRTLLAEPGYRFLRFVPSPRGRYLVLGGRDLHLLDCETGKHRRLDGPAPRSVHVAWSPDEREIAYVTVEGKLVVVEIDRPQSFRELGDAGDMGASWSPDGRWIAYAGGETEMVSLITPDGKEHLTGLLVGKGEFLMPSWSADGRLLVGLATRQVRVPEGIETEYHETVIDLIDRAILMEAHGEEHTSRQQVVTDPAAVEALERLADAETK